MSFVISIFSKEGKDYQLSPPRDVCVFDWIASLKVIFHRKANKQIFLQFYRGIVRAMIARRLKGIQTKSARFVSRDFNFEKWFRFDNQPSHFIGFDFMSN